jgi:hypothetical protein
MIALAGQQVRLPMIGLVFLAFFAFAGGYAVRPPLESPSQVASVAQAVPAAPAAITVVRSEKAISSLNDCQTGSAYVTGDMVGDASPSAIYDAMCSTRTIPRL